MNDDFWKVEQVKTLSSKSMLKALLGNLFGIFGDEFFILCLEKSLPLAMLEKLTRKTLEKKILLKNIFRVFVGIKSFTLGWNVFVMLTKS